MPTKTTKCCDPTPSFASAAGKMVDAAMGKEPSWQDKVTSYLFVISSFHGGISHIIIADLAR